MKPLFMLLFFTYFFVGIHLFISKHYIEVGNISLRFTGAYFQNEFFFVYIYSVLLVVLFQVKALRKPLIYFSILLLSLRLIFHAVDSIFILSFGDHFSRLIYTDVDVSSVLNFITIKFLFLFILVAIGIYYLYRLQRQLFYSFIPLAELGGKKLSIYFLLTFILAIPFLTGPKKTSFYFKKFSAEGIILTETLDHFFPKKIDTLPETIAQELLPFGVTPEIQMREHIFKDSLEEFSYLDKPNVFVYMLESFTTELVNYYNSPFEELTPEIDAFLADSNTVVFDSYVNSTFPSIVSVMANIFSFQEASSHHEIDGMKTAFRHGFRGMASILKEQGYNCYFITGISADFTQMRRIFSTSDFEVFDEADIKDALNEDGLIWGFSDHQMIRYYDYFIKNVAKEPYFIFATSTENHTPYHTPPDGIQYKDGSRGMLNTVRTTDRAFGKFLKHQDAQNQFKNTIVALSSDHAPQPNNGYWGLFTEEQKEHVSTYLKMPLGVRFPNAVKQKRVNKMLTSVDFAPTLLHMMNVNSPNLFEGYSVFERPDTLLYYFPQMKDITYFNKTYGNKYQKEKVKRIQLTDDELAVYRSWKKQSFLKRYESSKQELQKTF